MEVFRVVFFIGDLLLLNLSILFSLSFYGGAFWVGADVNNIYLLVFSNLGWLFLVMVSNPYAVTKGWGLSRIVKSQLAFLFIHILVVISMITLFRQHYSFLQIGLIYVLFIPTFFTFRVISLYLRKVLTADIDVRNYMIIGRNELAGEIRKHFVMNPESNYKFQGYLDFNASNFTIEQVEEFCTKNEIHEIYVCAPDVDERNLQSLVNFGLDSLIKVKLISSRDPFQHSINLDQYERLPGIDVSAIPLDEAPNQFIKRVFDFIFASAFVVLVVTWLFPIIAIAIKLDSRGPVFFVQLRSGRGNKPFKCLKFRTMRVNTESDSKQATKNDDRITKLGHLLRRTSIDELPQFINVLVGTMSVVGPRPHMLKHTDEYSKLIDRFMGRHYVKPGITGLAQCLGYRGETKDLIDMENRVRMDRYYIENWSFWFDLKIMFLTVVSLVRGSDKAY